MTDLVSILFGGARSGGGSALPPATALAQAERTKTRQIAQIAKQPDVVRELAAFDRALAQAKTPEDFLKSIPAVKVLLSADGLDDQAQNLGLVRRALTSDLADPRSAANQLRPVAPGWYDAARRYDFENQGLAVLRRPAVIEAIKAGYLETRWRDSLEAQTPGLGLALEFKSRAARLGSAIAILGDPVGRAVVTTAYAIPPEIARQGLPAQERAITAKLDPARLKNPAFADAVARRYLIAVAQQAAASAAAPNAAAAGIGLIV